MRAREKGLQISLNSCLSDMLFPPSGEENSMAFMPNTEVMNERGKKMMVTIVKSIIERP